MKEVGHVRAKVRQAVRAIDQKIAQLRTVRNVLDRLGRFADDYQPAKKRPRLSAAARHKISVAQKKRWARHHAKVVQIRRSA